MIIYTREDICNDCANALMCDCSQKHAYGCKIESSNMDRVSGTCSDREEIKEINSVGGKND